MIVCYNGYTLEVEVTYFNAGEDAVTHLLPEDCYEGDQGEVEYEITSMVIDCEQTVIDERSSWNEETLCDIVFQQYSEENS